VLSENLQKGDTLKRSRSWIGEIFAQSVVKIQAARRRLDGQRSETPKARRATRGTINQLNAQHMEAVNWGDFRFHHT
jgi:hypothetical protein